MSCHFIKNLKLFFYYLHLFSQSISPYETTSMVFPKIKYQVQSFSPFVNNKQWCAPWPLSWFLSHVDSAKFMQIRFDSTHLWRASIRDSTHDSQKQGAAQNWFNSQFNSPMIAYTGFNSMQFNKKQDSYLIHVNTGTQTWEYSVSDFCECYKRTMDIEIQNEPATDFFFVSSWKFPCAPPWFK